MNTQQTMLLEVDDQPDVLVRIMQVVHRRNGHIRSLQVSPGTPTQVRLNIEGVENPIQITRSLEKLIDVHHARFVAK